MNEPLPMDGNGPKLPPTYPPRTPPPQRKPVEPPRPKPSTRPVTTSLPLPGPGQARVQTRRPRMTVRNRRAANWAFTAYPWTAAQVVTKVTATVRAWGYVRPDDDQLQQAVRLLVGAVTVDHGRRISVHLADQEGMFLIAVLSHADAVPDETVLANLAAVPGTASCGTDASDDGRRVWAVLSTDRPRTRTRGTPAA